MQNRPNRFMPLIMAVCVVIGIVIGTFYANHFSGNRLSIINSGSNRLSNLLHIIDDQYVDPVNIDSLVEKAIPEILSDLDPHSVYISAKDVQSATDDLKGSFSGIGVEFTILNDTIRVQSVIANGPAEKAGIIAGDKIVEVDSKKFVGKIVTNDEAMRRLKGEKDTKVKIGVVRFGEKDIKRFVITRGDIPQKSITSCYMINEDVGYIKIKNFGESTYNDLLLALAKLQSSGFDRLVLDLRENTGGYLLSAVQIANEFLPKNRLIVYTQGRKSPRENYKSDGRGQFSRLPLVVLIDEVSASASEIFAGAMQDNDRATIVGCRSFGKGLVQQQIEFPDGSLIRLTVARYYTPSGRCIQKPYVMGDDESYQNDLAERFDHGEYFKQDSIKHSGQIYHTSLGRVVYGGGGITPDIFVPRDTTRYTSYFAEAVATGQIMQYAFTYTDNNRLKLNNFTEMAELKAQLEKDNTVEKFATYADKHGLQRRNLMIKKSYPLLERAINGRIIYNIMSEDELMQYTNLNDDVIKAALKAFEVNNAFPQKPAPKKQKTVAGGSVNVGKKAVK